MEKSLLNDEETEIMKVLEGLPQPEKIKILEDSIASEPEESGRRVLRSLILKLKKADRGASG
ncbi:MAG: hypothetical protein LKJ45_07805 [Oscillospiraceae bacterium]|jgi:hypothetical protein|nr:hypothetical protein [Oscillospiraceae bacterium]